MCQLTKKGKKDPLIRELALRIVNHLPPKKWGAEVMAIRDFVRDHIRFTRDIRGVETLQTPKNTLRLRAGDCDDMAILTASLLEAIHHPTRFMAVGFSPANYCHVFPETKIGGRWVSVETTENVNLGWYPKGVKSAMVRHN